MMTRMEDGISRRRQLDQKMAARLLVLPEYQLAPRFADAGRDRPWGLGTGGETDAVVIDREDHLACDRSCTDRGRASPCMTANVPDALEHDVEDVLDQRRGTRE